MLAVRADNYRAFYIRALIRNIIFFELLYSLLVRMTVVVILAAGDERERRRNDLEELLARRRAAAVSNAAVREAPACESAGRVHLVDAQRVLALFAQGLKAEREQEYEQETERLELDFGGPSVEVEQELHF